MAQEQHTNIQVEGIIFQKTEGGKLLFLLMRRIPSRGGFWQPLTGGIRIGENLEEGLLREIREETGIIEIVRIISTGYTFNFKDHDKDYIEYVYGVEVPADISVILSHEHDLMRWVPKEEALALFKWPGNIEGLQRLCSILEFE